MRDPLLSLFMGLSPLLSFTTPSVLRSLDNVPILHYTLNRRGGSFAPTESAYDHVNLSYLAQQLETADARFNLTQRQVEGNKLVRKAKIPATGSKDEGALMGEVASEGVWYVWTTNNRKSAWLIPYWVLGMLSSRSATLHKRLKWTSTC